MRMREVRHTFTVLVAECEGTRLIRRLIRRWEDNMKVERREIVCMKI